MPLEEELDRVYRSRQEMVFWFFGKVTYGSAPGDQLYETEFLWSYTPITPINRFRPYLTDTKRNRNT